MKTGFEMLDQFMEECQPTQENYAEEFSNWIGEAGQKMIEEDAREFMALNKVKVREERPLQVVLAELDEEMQKFGHPLPGLFNPGLSPEEIKDTLKTDQVNPDLLTLYSWHNGFINWQGLGSDLFLNFSFLPLQEAWDRKQHLSDFIPPYFVPIMDDIFGNHLEISLTGEGEFKDILCQHVHDGSSLFYPSPAAFFAAVSACLREGLFCVDKRQGLKGEDIIKGNLDKLSLLHGRYRFA